MSFASEIHRCIFFFRVFVVVRDAPKCNVSEREARARALDPEDASVLVVAAAGASVERTTYVREFGVRRSGSVW